MILTSKQNNDLHRYKNSYEHTKENIKTLTNRLQQHQNYLGVYERRIKYLEALRDDNLIQQLEAKLNWVMFETMEFTYEGIQVVGKYVGSFRGGNTSLRINGNHYNLKQIIAENIKQ